LMRRLKWLGNGLQGDGRVEPGLEPHFVWTARGWRPMAGFVRGYSR
jgi:hypothetical protein